MGRKQEEDLAPGAADRPWDREEFKARRRVRYYRDGQPRDESDTAENFIAQYTPKSIPPDVWQRTGPLTREAAQLAYTSRSDPWIITNTVAHFVWWMDREGSPLTPHAFHPDLIDRYVASLQHLTNGSRGNVRTILSRVGAKALGPPLFPPPRVLSKRPKLMTPFNDDQVVELVSAVRGQTTAYRRDNFAALLAIFLGAGPRSEEGLRATGADVERDEYGVLLHITTGHHPRAIPVVRRWEAHIVAAAERVGERPLFLPNRRRLQRYDAPNFIKNLDLPPGLPHLTLRRLRCTWIVDHLLRGTPAHLLAEAAGMTTDQVGRYARHLPVPPPDQLRSILRGPKQ